MAQPRVGRVVRVAGPIVEGEGIEGIEMGEVVYVGYEQLLGEVVRISGGRFSAQVYEDTEGLRPGEPIVATGRPFVVELGPGLLASVIDGIGRPLKMIEERMGPFIGRGLRVNTLPRDRRWEYRPLVKRGDELGPGDVFGVVQETPLVEHRLMVPPEVHGVVVDAAPEGSYAVDEPLVTLDAGGSKVELTMKQEWPARRPRPYAERLPCKTPLITGQRVIDTLFPVAKGGTVAIPGGFGTGKTVTLHKISMYSDSKIVVYIGCGERGNEVAEMLEGFSELVDPATGRPIMERSVIIANTSNMPVSAREASIHIGATIAEYYRDQGYDVTLIADSTSRWAEALREVGSRLGELPVEEGYPAYLPDSIARFYERAGRVKALGRPERFGSLTIIGAVSPPGGDFSEPVTVYTLRFVGCMWALDTELAYRRHFPAINWMRSFSRYAEEVEKWWSENVSPEFARYRRKALQILSLASEIESIASIVGESALPDEQRLVLLAAEVLREGFLRQVALRGEDTFCEPVKQFWLLKLMVDFFDKAYELVRSRVPAEEIASLPAVHVMQRVKEDERGVEAVRELYERVMRDLKGLAEKYGVSGGGRE
mgnify:CR=1 FL=1